MRRTLLPHRVHSSLTRQHRVQLRSGKACGFSLNHSLASHHILCTSFVIIIFFVYDTAATTLSPPSQLSTQRIDHARSHAPRAELCSVSEWIADTMFHINVGFNILDNSQPVGNPKSLRDRATMSPAAKPVVSKHNRKRRNAVVTLNHDVLFLVSMSHRQEYRTFNECP